MRNKRGFTLVELLATITILGVIMMIAVPTVSIYINKSKVDSFVYTAKQYEKSAEDLYLLDRIQCNGLSAFESGNGSYVVWFTTNSSGGVVYNNYKKLIKEGGKSPFGNIDVAGFIYFVKTGDSEDETINWYISLRDAEGNGIKNGSNSYVNINELNSSKIVRKDAPMPTVPPAPVGEAGAISCNIN